MVKAGYYGQPTKLTPTLRTKTLIKALKRRGINEVDSIVSKEQADLIIRRTLKDICQQNGIPFRLKKLQPKPKTKEIKDIKILPRVPRAKKAQESLPTVPSRPRKATKSKISKISEEVTLPSVPTNEVPFPSRQASRCLLCGIEFTQRRSVYRHLKNVEKVEQKEGVNWSYT
jgi:hypothetical protein